MPSFAIGFFFLLLFFVAARWSTQPPIAPRPTKPAPPLAPLIFVVDDPVVGRTKLIPVPNHSCLGVETQTVLTHGKARQQRHE